MRKNNKVKAAVKTLARDIIKTIEQVRKTKGIKPIEEPYVKDVIIDFKYSTASGIKELSTSEEIIKKEEYWSKVPPLIRLFSKLPSFEKAKEMIEKQLGVKEEYAQKDLSQFCRVLAVRYLEKGTDAMQITVDTFLSEINNEPTDCQIYARLNGITLETEPFEYDVFTLRRPVKEDLIRERPVYRSFQIGYPSDLLKPSAILEIRCKVTSAIEAQEILNKFKVVLLLFGNSRIEVPEYTIISDSVTKYIHGTVGSLRNSPVSRPYFFKTRHYDDFKDFYNFMNKNLPEPYIDFSKIDDKESAGIAYTRYYDSLYHSYAPERQIMDLIMGLESLFLAGAKQELKYRVQMRVCNLMSHFGHDSKKIYELLQHTYGIRNKYAHGAFAKKDIEKLRNKYGSHEKPVTMLRELLKCCILFFEFAKPNKQTIVGELDEQMYLQNNHINGIIDNLPTVIDKSIKRVFQS